MKEIHGLILQGEDSTDEERQAIMKTIYRQCFIVAKRYLPDEAKADGITWAFCHIVDMAIPWNKKHLQMKKFFSTME